jgi:general secretion pathway protein G
MKKQKGFTLIELLVVIAIIGLLSTLAVVALNNARQKSRDARRISDIKQIQTALELYYNEAGTYPADITPGEALALDATTYMNIVPSNPEPQNDGPSGEECCVDADSCNYLYTQDNSGASYNIQYCLGGSTGGLENGTHYATPSGIAND